MLIIDRELSKNIEKCWKFGEIVTIMPENADNLIENPEKMWEASDNYPNIFLKMISNFNFYQIFDDF